MRVAAQFYDAEEAQIAAGFLRSHGIEVTVGDTHTLAAQPHLRIGVGGFRLMVDDRDYYQASQLLAPIEEKTASSLGPCENCGEHALARVRNVGYPLLSVILGFLAPFAPPTKTLRCRACGHKQADLSEESHEMSLDQSYDPGNVFAKIIAGEIPSAKVYEDAEILAFMDAFPQSEGHTLVISKTAQAVNLLDMEPETLSSLMVHTQRIAKAVAAALNPDGFRLVQFNGAPAGQSVFHLHFHIIPVWEGKSLGAHGGGQAAMEDLTRLAENIRDHL